MPGPVWAAIPAGGPLPGKFVEGDWRKDDGPGQSDRSRTREIKTEGPESISVAALGYRASALFSLAFSSLTQSWTTNSSVSAALFTMRNRLPSGDTS